MFQPFICGSGTLNHHEEDDDSQLSSSPVSTPTKSRRKSFYKSHNKNPYSDRGRDKFSALLAELEEKRQKIYSQTGSQDISFVRFVYKNSTDCVPIVVKLKDKTEDEIKKKPASDTKDHETDVVSEEILDKHPTETLTEGKEVRKKILGSSPPDGSEEKKNKKKNKSFSWNMELQKWRRPSYYLPAFIVLILLLLVVFGRSVTILFTCIGWYIVPTIQEKGSSNVRRSMKKKDYGRKLSENKLVSEGLSSPRSKRSSPARDRHR